MQDKFQPYTLLSEVLVFGPSDCGGARLLNFVRKVLREFLRKRNRQFVCPFAECSENIFTKVLYDLFESITFVINERETKSTLKSFSSNTHYNFFFKLINIFLVEQLMNPYAHKPPFRFATVPSGSTEANLRKNYPDMYNYMKPYNRTSVQDGVRAVKEQWVHDSTF